MKQDSQSRDIRIFHIYKGAVLVLIVEDRPGILLSTAMPAPSGPPAHPFIHASALDALSEDELGSLLRQSKDFDSYLNLLIASGYDIMSGDSPSDSGKLGGLRIEEDKASVGVIWPGPGQFTTLTWQPLEGQLTFPHATMSVYRQGLADSFLALMQQTLDYEALCEAVQDQDFRLVPLSE